MEAESSLVKQYRHRLEDASRKGECSVVHVSSREQCPFTVKACYDCDNPIYTRDGKRTKYKTEICRNRQRKLGMIAKSGLMGKDLDETFTNAVIDQYNQEQYDFYQHEWNRKDWLWIQSKENGTGKSYTANAIANMLMEHDIQPLVIREVDMAMQIQDTFSDKSGDSAYALMGKYKCIPVLVIQDIGKYGARAGSEWWPQQIFDIIDYRIINRMPMVMTSNFDLMNADLIESRFGANHGAAIQSRLLGQCTIIEMKGSDRRCG